VLKGEVTASGSADGFVERIDLREAAARLGVHYMTAYRYVRLGRLPAVQERGRWWVDPSDVQRFRRQPAVQGRRRQPAPSAYRPRLMARLLAGDEPGSWGVVESAMVAGASAQDVVLDILAPVLRQVGDGWERGELTVGDEHRVTSVALRLFGRLSSRFGRPGRSRGAVVLAGAAGDPHSLPLAMLAAVLRGAGWSVVELGADTPTADLVAAVEAVSGGPRAVGLSISVSRYCQVVRDTIQAVRVVAPTVPILVGGPAMRSEDRARAVSADAWAADAIGVLDFLDALEDRSNRGS
jgi:excisionase family DNA binding protein